MSVMRFVDEEDVLKGRLMPPVISRLDCQGSLPSASTTT